MQALSRQLPGVKSNSKAQTKNKQAPAPPRMYNQNIYVNDFKTVLQILKYYLLFSDSVKLGQTWLAFLSSLFGFGSFTDGLASR